MGSLEAAPLKDMRFPTLPEYGPPALAVGACGAAATVAVVLAVAESLSVFVTVSVTV